MSLFNLRKGLAGLSAQPLKVLFMSNSLQELIDIAFDVKVFFNLSSYVLYQFEDGSFVDFHVKKIEDPVELLRLSQGLDVRMYAEENYITVRLYERFCE